jgi:hypothetical protein
MLKLKKYTNFVNFSRTVKKNKEKKKTVKNHASGLHASIK